MGKCRVIDLGDLGLEGIHESECTFQCNFAPWPSTRAHPSPMHTHTHTHTHTHSTHTRAHARTAFGNILFSNFTDAYRGQLSWKARELDELVQANKEVQRARREHEEFLDSRSRQMSKQVKHIVWDVLCEVVPYSFSPGSCCC